ncbi:hypothetical protein A6F68_00275 [Tsuneonella dongtanensis]|uniref:Uncharacterized protein n=1 Tax=Tsuneonella dongtanensis TaxID=692370 RepID=A0A1B2A9H8_9SPHN|nr:phage tail protein [Tsuneonella dongtanensis]ANY18810.1 hypothetical protein A6F68_00275 [Tsuneonella dongtanensis]
MATLVLTTVGTLLGGPIGGAIGALAGRSVDGALFGGGRREGPRLKELAVTTSSYGQPIPRFHGRMRAGGTIVWATDLVERREKSGGKKGQPSVTSYSYTTSFAVVLSSRPIQGVGRIWADGNLLRGAGGDLKVAGSMRIHTGHGDQRPDPLIAAAEGSGCPAFRGCAYVVFEDLALGDFGNRIPALSFEIVADEGAMSLAGLTESVGDLVSGSTQPLVALAGFASEGGPFASTLSTIDALFPLSCDCGGSGLAITLAGDRPGPGARVLPAASRAWSDDDFGIDDGERSGREAGERSQIDALRYYDVARDFQPGIQRPARRAVAGQGRTVEFPGALAADGARGLAETAARRSAWGRDHVQWRMAELDPDLAPGNDVRIPGRSGVWRIESWEWRSRGIEVDLVRRNPSGGLPAQGDPGAIPLPDDALPGPTVLSVFEVPAAGLGAGEATLFAAATAASGGWSGAALYFDRAGELVPIGNIGRARATVGHLIEGLSGSAGLHFEPDASLRVDLASTKGSFTPASLSAIAQGANRLRVGGEIVQFAMAEQVSPSIWQLTGLLRGRGGTEPEAIAGHLAGTDIALIDDDLVALDSATVPSDPSTILAAIGLGDPEPVYARLANAGIARRPACPVHPRVRWSSSGNLSLAWTRRARGAWHWPDTVEVPLVEQEERYRIGLGPVDSPFAEWQTGSAELDLTAEVLEPLRTAYPGASLWVRQIGSFAQSVSLFLTTLR